VQRGLVFRLCGSDAGFRFASAAAAADLGALAVTVRGSVRDDAQNVRVSVRLAGVAADLAAAVKRLVALASSAGAALELDAGAEDARVAEWSCDVRDFPVRAPGDLVVRLATLPSRLAFLTAAVGAVFHGSAGTWQADAFRGTLLVAVASARAASVLAALTRIADTAGARLVVERWPLDLAATIVVWHPLPPAFPLMERMKRALDPQGVFAAGRFVGGL
jgi:FAD/FMN-containing dehydrogenase